MSGNDTGYEGADAPTSRYFFDDEPRTPSPHEAEPRPLGFLRHLASLVLALALAPVALVLIDYGMVRRQDAVRVAPDEVDARALLALVGAGAVLFVVALLARLSPLGPLVAGLVWGLVPWVLVTFLVDRTFSWLGRLPELYDLIGINALNYGFGLYAVVAALLVGTGCAAAWHRR